jgi:hypothetical protein
MGYAKVIQRKNWKNGQVSEWLKKWVLRCLPKKREKKRKGWIRWPMFSCKSFQVSKEKYVFKGHSRIRIATIYPSSLHTHAHLDLIVWLNSLWAWLYSICIASMLFRALNNSHELHISLSVGRRHNIIHCLGEDPQIPHIWETWDCHTMNLWVLFQKLIKTLK